jgi:2-keto-4-pentenoate hydratase/2-oxohepta-3-ene-1,7-dioic acid hydratase in catechol pathway
MQDANTRDMIHDVPALIEFLSQSTTLLPGTVIFTGTPSGVGMAQNPPLWLKDGDEVSVTIEKIGTLTNRVCGCIAEAGVRTTARRADSAERR